MAAAFAISDKIINFAAAKTLSCYAEVENKSKRRLERQHAALAFPGIAACGF